MVSLGLPINYDIITEIKVPDMSPSCSLTMFWKISLAELVPKFNQV